MGLLKGEGTILRNKYMKKYGLTQMEAFTMVEDFVDKINVIRDKMRAEKKMVAEIDLTIQRKFEEEFQKLCCD